MADNLYSDECWLPVVGFPDYSVSNRGRVMRTISVTGSHAGRILKPELTNNGYNRTALTLNGKIKKINTHRLVCAAFNGPQPDEEHYYVAHWDGDKQNNVPSNLRWATPAENGADKVRMGEAAKGDRNGSRSMPHRLRRGETNPSAKLTEDMVRDARRSTETQSVCAARLGVSQSAIGRIRRGTKWAHVI